MKVLFSMRHSGALRNFASTIRGLAAAGHQVHLVFMMADKRGDGRLLRELAGESGAITYAWAADAKARGFWAGVQRGVRTGGDYLRYHTPDYASAGALRERAAARVPEPLRSALQARALRTRAGLKLALRAFAAAEASIPADRRVLDLVAAAAPDLVLVTPLLDLGSDQVEYLKAARALGVRTGLAVHSWDNLTNKGVLRIQPDRVFVWNDAQRHEAVALHGVAPEAVVVTGAPVYDQWFSRGPSTTRDGFCAKAGLRPGAPFLLYLCSSAFIASDEAAFVRKWVSAIRSAPDPLLREVGVLVRPHPDNPGPWRHAGAAPHGVAVWPKDGADPVDRASKDDYFDSIYHSAAAVGINTSAQIEAGIVGRRVYSVRVPEYAKTQDGTLHFRHLTGHGGLLRVADTLEQHVRDLADALRNGGGAAGELSAFVRAFVRPFGLDVAATPRLVDAIEALGAMPKPAPETSSVTRYPGRLALYPLAAASNAGQSIRRRARKRIRLFST